MGAVYEASDLRLGRRVAVKVMVGSLFGNQQALRRFEREARATARLDHVNITRVYDYGSIGSDGAFLVMELLAGVTWRAELQRQGPIAPSRAVGWFDQLLLAVAAAHAAGVIHRDLKPENVILGGGDVIKVLDFGLARLHAPDSVETQTVTVPGTVMGTFGYMAPEQITGGNVDERTDLFTIAVMLVETLTGSRPFTGKTPGEFLRSVLHDTYHLENASGLDAVLQRGLAKQKEARWESAEAFRAALIPALRASGPLRAVAVSPGAVPTVGDTV
jgi:serine/threonine-protein kinase